MTITPLFWVREFWGKSTADRLLISHVAITAGWERLALEDLTARFWQQSVIEATLFWGS
jgi:hypothetical protein